MNLDELRSVQSKERSKDSLQHLRESFYADVGDYIRGLREERERAAERADDPFDSAEVNRLTDEIKTAEEVVEAVYERRVGKVVKRACLAAAGMPADEEGLTTEEQELFSDLVGRIEANKGTVLDVLAGETGGEDTSSSDPTPSTPAETEEPATEGTESPSRPPSEAETVAGGPAEDPSTGSDPDPDPDERATEQAEPAAAESGDDPTFDERTTVRITRDVGNIFGVDEREYTLSSEDVVSLPAENAAPLIERDAAEKLE